MYSAEAIACAPPSVCPRAVDCVVCHRTPTETAFSNRFPWLMRCASCGLRFASPQPSEAELAEIYGPKYYQTFGMDPETEAGYRRMKRAQAKRLLTFFPRTSASARLLDVGSGLGDLVAAAQHEGWEALGIERNPHAVALANQWVPGRTVEGVLEGGAGIEGPFEAVTCLEVIEHLRRPDASLRLLFHALRPGGRLLLTTPDAGSWRARWMGPRWYHIHRDHLWYFDRPSLGRLVTDAGFEVLDWQPARKAFNLAYVLGVLSVYSQSRITRLIARLGRRYLPSVLQTVLLPPITEGQLLVAQRPVEVPK